VKKVFLVLIVVAFSFCSKKKVENPKGLYTIEQIAVFLKDLYIVQEQVKNLDLSDDSTKVIFAHYEKELYDKHGLEDSLYRESFKYYMDDVKGLAKVYEIIADSLSLEEQLLNSRPESIIKAQEEDEDEEDEDAVSP
jgi:hypothetical protein